MNQIDPRVVEWRRSLRRAGRVEVGGRWPTRSTRLVVDPDGLWVRSGDLRIPWSGLVDAKVVRVRGTGMLLLGVTEEFHARWLEGRGWLVRAMWVFERIFRAGGPQLRVPGRLAVDLDVLAGWLDDEIDRRSRLAQL